MDLFAPVVRHVVAPLQAFREGRPVYRILRELERTQYLPPAEIRARQEEKLHALIAWAGERCPFHAGRFRAAGLDPASFSMDDFRRLPPLTKADVRAHGADLLARGFPEAKRLASKTGGSTSVPLQFFVDFDSNVRKTALALRNNSWAGWNVGDKVAMVWGAHDLNASLKIRLRNLLLDRAIALDTLRLDAAMMHDFARRMRSHRPTVVFGHSHSMYILASFMRRHGYGAPTVRTVISTSTVLADIERATLEDVFQCKVFDRYGCEEVSLIASECDAHSGMHLNSDHLLVEFLVEGRPAAPGECGEIHLTDLTNVAMPFIRYRVEDAGTPTDRACPCGRGLPLMEKVQGRVADFIVTPEGRVIFGVSILDNFTAKFLGLERVQIVQERMDHLLFRVVKGADFTDEVLAAFRARIPEFFGPTMKYDFEFVDQIPREASGKYRFTISKVANPFQEAADRSPNP
ncbi:MAG: phenylacetate--CoA ligase family protein [Candidatus Eisenbacteria bacterium]|nr:phenylacetate--CoA ligase family protein [Candidatus Eisenbacteria bacterium]